MEVRQAIDKAKDWIRNVYSDEDLMNLGLEEVRKDHEADVWRITVGFSRPWDFDKRYAAAPETDRLYMRSFKVVSVDDGSGEVLSIENRE